MTVRAHLAQAASGVLTWGLRHIARRPAANLPGIVGLALDPGLIADLRGRIVLVMGSEHDGVSRLVLETCDIPASLPQRGEVSSLNVAQASTVFMYEWLRQNSL